MELKLKPNLKLIGQRILASTNRRLKLLSISVLRFFYLRIKVSMYLIYFDNRSLGSHILVKNKILFTLSKVCRVLGVRLLSKEEYSNFLTNIEFTSIKKAYRIYFLRNSFLFLEERNRASQLEIIY